MVVGSTPTIPATAAVETDKTLAELASPQFRHVDEWLSHQSDTLGRKTMWVRVPPCLQTVVKQRVTSIHKRLGQVQLLGAPPDYLAH